MSSALLIFALQFFFQLTRTLGTRYVSKDNVAGSVFLSFFIQALWLTTTFLGVKFMAEMDWAGITGYMIGGLLGVYVSMKFRIGRSYKPEVFESMKNVKFYKPEVFEAIANIKYPSYEEMKANASEDEDTIIIKEKINE